MRRLLAWLCALALSAASPAPLYAVPAAWGGIYSNNRISNVVSLGSGANQTTTTITVTTAADAPVGSTIVIAVQAAAAALLPIVSVSDGTANSYTLTAVHGSAIQYAYSINIGHDVPSSSSLVVTITSNGPQARWVVLAMDAQGVAAVDAYPAITTGTSTSPSVASGALSSTAEIVFGTVGWFSNAAYTEASGFTQGPINQAGAFQLSGDLSYKIVNSAASVTYAPTLGATVAWQADILTFTSL